MLEAAHAMFDEALITHAARDMGLVDPNTEWLQYYDGAYST
jgi:hypothetical protein